MFESISIKNGGDKSRKRKIPVIMTGTKYLKNYIYTSSVKFENSKKSDEQSDTPEKEVEGKSEFLKTLNFKKAKQGSSTSLDVEEKDASSRSVGKSKKSKKSEKHEKVKKPGSGLENFFAVASVKKNLRTAAESVAEELGENKEAVKNELMKYLQTLEVTKEKPKQDKFKYKVPPKPTKPDASLESILSNVKSLNLFNNLCTLPEESQVKLNIWDDLEHEELVYLSKTHPRNHFEELINWTNEGRMWHFPIDNDQGLDEEAKITFTQHIFLDQYLDSWCPKKGPLRRFMDLVLIGLGKNPYLSVEEKVEHIKWFQDYFDSKRKLLKEVGAVTTKKEIEAPDSN